MDITHKRPRYYNTSHAAGRVFDQSGVSHLVPKLSSSKAPPRNVVIDGIFKKHMENDHPQLLDKVVNGWVHTGTVPASDDPVQGCFAGSSAHATYVREFKLDTEDDVFDFLDSVEAVATDSTAAAALTLTAMEDYTNSFSPHPDFTDDKQIDMITTFPVMKGAANFTCADGHVGDVEGDKVDNDFVAKNVLICLIRTFREHAEMHCQNRGRKVFSATEWAHVFDDYFLNHFWRYFFALYIVLFRKAETIQAGKICRLVWAVDILNIFLDYVVKKPLMKMQKKTSLREVTLMGLPQLRVASCICITE